MHVKIKINYRQYKNDNKILILCKLFILQLYFITQRFFSLLSNKKSILYPPQYTRPPVKIILNKYAQ